jgi:hypothetical protein
LTSKNTSNVRFILRVFLGRSSRPTLSISGGAQRRPLHAVVRRPYAYSTQTRPFSVTRVRSSLMKLVTSS